MNKDPFREYIWEAEPDKRDKGYAWHTAIGLQAVDGLKTSEYLELFLRNRLLDEKHPLHNRTMHISRAFQTGKKANIQDQKANIEGRKANMESLFSPVTASHVRSLLDCP